MNTDIEGTVRRSNADGGEKTLFDRANAFIAGLVFLITLIVYVKTVAPTLSFWDCGEFIACSYILGIPHPPGSPLYVIIGRIFSILPIASDIAVRVNLFSVVSGAAAAFFGYLVTVRLIRFWYDDRGQIRDRITTYIGGFTGSLFMAFASTNWGNSVEAEVYSPTMLIMMVVYWLTLKYFESRETPPGGRFMLLGVYLAMLGVGIHLTLFVIVPVLAIYFILKKEALTRHWAIVALFFFAELFLLFMLSSRPGEVPYFLPILILFIVFVFHSVLLNKITRPILVAIILYLVAVWPIYFLAVDVVSSSLTGSGLADSIGNLASAPVGWIGFVGLIAWGLFSVFKLMSQKNTDEERGSWMISAVYSLTPAILLGIGSLLSGYYAFMALTLIVIGLVALVLWRYINRLILIGFGAISMVILGFWFLIIGIVAGGAAIMLLGILFKDKSWQVALAIIMLAVVGYSVNIFIPIRSAHNPAIDENNPSRSFTTLVRFLERKQYGTESMTARMFERRGEWTNQFGDYRRMGFWHFFKEQYGFRGPRFLIALILGLFGIWETIRRKPEIGLPFLTVILVCSVGFVLYMNFADGTRQDAVTGRDYLEVRNRDYFFTPAFVFFGLAIGLGIAAFIELVKDTVRNYGSGIRNGVFGAVSLLVLLPLMPLTGNYFYNDRSRNYMPFDYANNSLMSCPPDALFITTGDNDTFPIWCLQEVYGIRKDVRLVNLSLGNTDWYIKQLRDKLNVPIVWTDKQIEDLRPYRDKDGTAFRIQDQLTDHIIAVNKWKDPIVFTVSAPSGDRRFRGKSLEENLILQGMVYRLTPTRAKNQINIELTQKLYEEQFAYRGTADPTVYKNETCRRLGNNYAQGFLFLADTMKSAGDYEAALGHIRKGLEVIPWSYDIYVYAAQTLGEMGRLDTLQAFIDGARIEEKWKLYFNWGMAAKIAGNIDEAIEVLEMCHELYPEYFDGYRALVSTLYQNRRYAALRKLVEDRVAGHPDDVESVQLLQQIKSIDVSRDTIEGNK